MKVIKHPNYYTNLLLMGASVVSPLALKPREERKMGRIWEAKAVLRFKGFDIYLKSTFHGANAETEEVAAANLNIDKIVMYVEGGSDKDYIILTRQSYVLLMLEDGIYCCADKSKKALDLARKICHYDTARYIGALEPEELAELVCMGYVRIIEWSR